MLSAILLSTVLIHCKLMPSGELINREQKKRPSKRPILDLLHVCRVQERAEELSVQKYRIWIVGDIRRRLQDMECCNVIYDYCDVLEDIYPY